MEYALLYGIINSIILSLLSLGFTLVYSISRLPNFAHGALYITCGYIVWLLLNKVGLPYPFAILLGIGSRPASSAPSSIGSSSSASGAWRSRRSSPPTPSVLPSSKGCGGGTAGHDLHPSHLLSPAPSDICGCQRRLSETHHRGHRDH